MVAGNGNGFHGENGNDHHPVKKPGGTGALQEGLEDHSHQRETLTMIRRGLTEGWLRPIDLDHVFVAKLPQLVSDSIARSQENSDERSLLRGVEVIQRFLEYNLRLAESVDGVAHASIDNHVTVRIEHAEVSRIAESD